jgi:hypothetical protein
MANIKLITGDFTFVEIPNDATRRMLGTFCNDKDLQWEIFKQGLYGEDSRESFLNFNANGCVIFNVRLCNNNTDSFEIIGSTKDITEDQAAEIVENNLHLSNDGLPFFKKYDNISFDSYPYDEPKESLESLMRSLDLKPDYQKYLIIKKVV